VWRDRVFRSSWRYALGRSVHAVVCWGWMKRCRTVSSCSSPAGMTPARSQLSLHHRLTHTGGCDVDPECENELPIHALLKWSSKDRVLSVVTPRLFTVLVSGTVTPAAVTLSTCGSDLCLTVVPMTIASVLSGFRQSPLASNQRWTDWKQSLITLVVVVTFFNHNFVNCKATLIWRLKIY